MAKLLQGKTVLITGGARRLGRAMALKLAKAGADIATIPYKVLKQMYLHPLTDKGIELFKADWDALQASQVKA